MKDDDLRISVSALVFTGRKSLTPIKLIMRHLHGGKDVRTWSYCFTHIPTIISTLEGLSAISLDQVDYRRYRRKIDSTGSPFTGNRSTVQLAENIPLGDLRQVESSVLHFGFLFSLLPEYGDKTTFYPDSNF